jgi:hypothetical protein
VLYTPISLIFISRYIENYGVSEGTQDGVLDDDRPEACVVETGRLSKETLDAIEIAFGNINLIFAQLATSTNLSPERLLHRYTRSRTLSVGRKNMWNIYQTYHMKNPTSEQANSPRSDEDGGAIEEGGTLAIADQYRAVDDANVRTAVWLKNEPQKQLQKVKQCYEMFKEKYPHTWQQILECFDEAEDCDESTLTVAERTRTFNRTVDQLRALVSDH